MSATFQIKPLLIGAFESGLNNYLNLDTQVEELLKPLTGKVIAIHITRPDETLYLCPNSTGIQILDNYFGSVDATLSGSLSALGLMGLSATPMHSLFKGEVRIEGNPEIARKLQNLFAKLDINLQSKLAQVTGERFAEQMSRFIRNGIGWSQNSLTTLRLNVEEFLQEETRNLPAKLEAEQFFQQIDTCRNDFDRLKARIDRLDIAVTKLTRL
ncbi:SCP2 sterol-binding domain-containing protein [Methylomonas sp. AM2-LC]|uniref:ubiquinone biosynthesis accessory factor UbiJ n=1 Tax=Methylomonas sp. AM2-LC TaxID=3153301 RepID=UPI0032658FA8